MITRTLRRAGRIMLVTATLAVGLLSVLVFVLIVIGMGAPAPPPQREVSNTWRDFGEASLPERTERLALAPRYESQTGTCGFDGYGHESLTFRLKRREFKQLRKWLVSRTSPGMRTLGPGIERFTFAREGCDEEVVSHCLEEYYELDRKHLSIKHVRSWGDF